MSLNRSRSSLTKPTKPTQTVTVYYWKRIILFVMLLLAFVGALTWFVYANLSSSESPPVPGSSLADEDQINKEAERQAELKATAHQEAVAQQKAFEKAAATITPADAPVFAPPEESSEPVEINAPTATAAATDQDSTNPPPATDTADIDSPEVALASDDTVTDSPVEAQIDEAVTEQEQAPESATMDDRVENQSNDDDTLVATDDGAGAADTPDTINVPDTIDAPDTTDTPSTAEARESSPAAGNAAVSVDIRANAIIRTELARGLRDKEPVGVYEQAVSLDGQSLITVFMFTQMRGYVDETIHHDWYLNDSRIARVAIKPWVSPMRASSSKKITPSMLGKWRVEIVDASDKILAVTTFQVVE